MADNSGFFAGVQSWIHSTLGEELFGVPMTPLVIGAFMCGVALFYLVMQRQLKRNAENRSV